MLTLQKIANDPQRQQKTPGVPAPDQLDIHYDLMLAGRSGSLPTDVALWILLCCRHAAMPAV